MNLAAVLAGTAVAVGLIGTLVPLLPGLWLIWVAMVTYGLIEGFGLVGSSAMVGATVALAAGTYLGVRIPQRSVADDGLGPRDQAAGLVFAIIGFFAIPVFGLAVGFVFGVFVVRWWTSRDRVAAWTSSKRAVIGLLKGSFAQFVAATAMALCFAVWVYVG